MKLKIRFFDEEVFKKKMEHLKDVPFTEAICRYSFSISRRFK
jgi:hypothetical protein